MADVKSSVGEAASNVRIADTGGALNSQKALGSKTAANADLQDVAPEKNPANQEEGRRSALPYPHDMLQIDAIEEQVQKAKTHKDRLTARRMDLRESARREAVEAGDGAVKVKLHRSHTHSGRTYKTGTEIFVDELSAKFLEENKIAERV